jgi:hypothetical protein
MRIAFIIAALTALASCNQETARMSDACALSAESQFTFSNSEAPDAASARAFGPSCNQAVVLLTLRNAAGDALWTHAGSYHAMVHGGPPPPGAPPVSEEDLQLFLNAWADVSINSSADLPPWSEDAARPGEEGQPFAYVTPFDREAYERLRAQDLAQVCFAAGAETSRCLVLDPATRTPALLAEYGP